MAPLPVINDVFRVTLDWNTFEGVSPRNVMHFLSNAGDEADLAATLDTELLNDMFLPMSISQEITSFSIIKLDGSSATQVIGSASATHGRGNNAISPATSAILSIHTAQRGPRGRGRLYVGPCTEDEIEAGKFPSLTPVNTMRTAWETFVAGMALGGAGYELGVASYVHSDFNGATSVSVPQVLATQRRRQDQLR